MTAAWCMPVSHKPPMVAVSIGLKRFSHELILQGKEFAINVPNSKLLKEMWCCGTKSGRTKDKFALCGLTPVVGKHIEAPLIGECLGAITKDKFALCGLTPVVGKHIEAPLIGECLGAIECRLESNPIAGDHSRGFLRSGSELKKKRLKRCITWEARTSACQEKSSRFRGERVDSRDVHK